MFITYLYQYCFLFLNHKFKKIKLKEFIIEGEAIAFDEKPQPDKVQVVVAWITDGATPKIERSVIGDGMRPRWSPDASKIALLHWGDQGPGIYVCNPDGSSKQKVAQGGSMLSWSPDSKRIAFPTVELKGHEGKDARSILAAAPDNEARSKLLESARMDIYSVNADGTGLKRLTTDGAFKWLLSYPPK